MSRDRGRDEAGARGGPIGVDVAKARTDSPPGGAKPEERTLRASHPTLVAAGRAIAEHREAMVSRWLEWLGDRISGAKAASRELTEAEFRLLFDVFATLVGPLRREARTLWQKVAQQYGRNAASRGLAAGEVVEELQYFRELLIRYLAPAIAAARPRQGMALLLRMNRLVDKGIAMAVVGYTDALVATLIPRESPDGAADPGAGDAEPAKARLAALREELDQIVTTAHP